MTSYRRAKIPGGMYFFTVNLAERQRMTLVENIDLLKRSLRDEQKVHPFRINALVILPDHLHAVLTLPDGNADFSGRWRRIKAAFSAALPFIEQRSASRSSKGERAYGSGVSGSISFVTNWIFPDTWITYTSTRSNTVMWRGFGIGRIRRFTGLSKKENIRWIGQEVMKSGPLWASRNEMMGFTHPTF